MVRLVGVDLPRNKRIAYALTYIHGIGLTSAKKIIEIAGINPETRSNDLTTEETITLRQALEDLDLKLEGDLRRFNGLNIKRLNEINVIEENDIVTIYQFVVNELERMLVLNVDRRRLLLVRKIILK
jgi:ribosomal protein S13